MTTHSSATSTFAATVHGRLVWPALARVARWIPVVASTVLVACSITPNDPPGTATPSLGATQLDVPNGMVEREVIRHPGFQRPFQLTLTIVRPYSSPEWRATATVCVLNASREKFDCTGFLVLDDDRSIAPFRADTSEDGIAGLDGPSLALLVDKPISINLQLERRAFTLEVDGKKLNSRQAAFDIAAISISCSSALCAFVKE